MPWLGEGRGADQSLPKTVNARATSGSGSTAAASAAAASRPECNNRWYAVMAAAATSSGMRVVAATTEWTPRPSRAAVRPSASSPALGVARPTSQAESTTCVVVSGPANSCANTGPSPSRTLENSGLCR